MPGPGGGLSEPCHSLGPRYQTTHPPPKGLRKGLMLWHPDWHGEAAGLSALTIRTTTRGRSHITIIKAHIQNLPTARNGSAGGVTVPVLLRAVAAHFPWMEKSPCQESSTLTHATVPPIPCIHLSPNATNNQGNPMHPLPTFFPCRKQI